MDTNDLSAGSGDALSRARELRASLVARRDAEAVMAEAVKVRQDAVQTADEMIAEAQRACDELRQQTHADATRLQAEAREHASLIIARAQREADSVVGNARATADEIRARALSDAEEHRQRVHAEVTAQVKQQMAAERARAAADARRIATETTGRLEGSLRTLSSSLDAAVTDVSEVLTTLREPVVTEREAAASDSAGDGDDRWIAHLTAASGEPHREIPEAPPSEQVQDPLEAGARPRSATEAFLSSNFDEVEQSERELRDLRAADQSRRRRAEEKRRALQGHPDRERVQHDTDDDGPETLRPLGWLFRSAP
jgi:cell division septum initiation protein DivIVA